MTGREKIAAKMSSPITLGDVVKLIVSIVGLVVLLGAGFVSWGRMEATTTISEVTTKEKLKAIELKHDKDHEQTRSFLEELDDDVHKIDKRQEVMFDRQKAQTKQLDEILREVRSN